MAVIGVVWNAGQNDDIHVLRGKSSRPLDRLLVIVPDQGDPFFLRDLDAAKRTQHAITNTQCFSITFPNGHGVTLNTATGVISADVAVPTVPYPRNFLVTGTVTATVDGSPKDFSVSLRVHVHTSVSQVFLSPPSLTVRFETTGAFKSSVGFSVLAKFNDNVIGDITRHGDPDNATTRLTWQNQSPSLIDMVNPTDATNGSFVAKISPPAGTAAFMQVQLPNELGSLNAVNPGQILFGEDWAKQRTIVPVSGSASTTPTDDALNLLLLPDGFVAGEEDAFKAYARNCITKWRSTKSFAPYDRMPINMFTVWIESFEKGNSVRNLLRYTNRSAGKVKARPMFIPQKPPAGQTPPVKKLEELIYVVGLPEPAESTATLRKSGFRRRGALIHHTFRGRAKGDGRKEYEDALHTSEG